MVCLDTPTSRATSSTARPASTCFKALIISASLCLPLDMVLPLSFDEIIFNFVRNQGSRSEPSNVHDRNAIRVLLQTGQQIGYISARQAARFKGKVHLLTATVHSRVKDKWGNETVKLRVSAEQKVYQTSTAPSVTAIQAEATKTVEKEGWQATLVYFENTAQGLFKVVKAEDAEAISQSLQEGMIQVGFIGLSDTPTGIP